MVNIIDGGIKMVETLEKEVSELSLNKEERNYSTFVEQYLEQPKIDKDKYSPIRSMGSWVIPTFCTFKGLPLIDDADDL